MESFLVGECGLTARQAALCSLEEFVQRRNGKDRELRDRWEIARWMAWQEALISPAVPANKKPSTPQAFCRFPWEKEEEVIAQEECHISEETKAWLNGLRERYHNKHSN